MVLSPDAATWEVKVREDGFSASCITPDCRGRLVTGRIMSGSSCGANTVPPPDARGGRSAERETLEVSGLSWLIARWRLGCRNAHPRSIAACTVHDGRTYVVESPLPSCRTGPFYGAEAAILRLISGIAPGRP